jgi:hypothetical protein
MAQKPPQKLFRVRFQDRDSKEPQEVVVTTVRPSEFFGLVTLEGFVFNDHKKIVILPNEDAARKRFGKTQRLHLPYHNLIYLEEFDEEPADVKHLPFVREVPLHDAASSPESE